MARERWLFDGWELTEGTLRDWALRAGTGETAVFIGENTSVPGRAGDMWRPKVQGPIVFTIDLWFKGSTREEVHAAYATILRAVRRRHRLVNVVRHRASGEQVTCDAELIGQIIPTHLSQRVWRASLTFKVPSGCWRSVSTYSHINSQSSNAFPKTIVLTNLEPSTEAMDDLTIKFHGPGTNITVTDITDGVDGDWLKYAAVMQADQFFTLNCRTWAWSAGKDSAPADASWFNLHAVQFNGGRYLSVAAARPGATPTVRVSVPGANGTTATYVQLSGPRSYAAD
jgi:hypothetical protein